MTARIGIDVGGTAIKLGLVLPGGRIAARARLDLPREGGLPALVAILGAACRDLEARAGQRASRIGVSTPGFTDAGSGQLLDGGNNVPALREGSLRNALAESLGRPVAVNNDGVAAAVGELRHGAGARFRRFVLLTLGTGVGGAVVLEGRVVTGSRGEPPELGALVLDAAGPPNRQGLPGTLEHFACAGAFLDAYRGSVTPPSLPELFARLGTDPQAAAAVDAVCGRIAQALGGLVSALNLEACLLGGGVAAAGAPLRDAVAAQLPRFTWPLQRGRVEVLLAETGNDAGLLGAAALASPEPAAALLAG
ncbi:ROK family protein [Roseomonas sp. BN140053]|uniref:ROK family protein n=1 Tax=Roseomonas sp. BN140053 TaxID=3391898 RepID=UPI0039E77046